MLFLLDANYFLRKFMSRRGPVRCIRSDNGTNFTCGHRELNSSIDKWNSECESWLTQKGITWKFQPPASSHVGGVWERELKTIRNILDALLNEP